MPGDYLWTAVQMIYWRGSSGLSPPHLLLHRRLPAGHQHRQQQRASSGAPPRCTAIRSRIDATSRKIHRHSGPSQIFHLVLKASDHLRTTERRERNVSEARRVLVRLDRDCIQVANEALRRHAVLEGALKMERRTSCSQEVARHGVLVALGGRL